MRIPKRVSWLELGLVTILIGAGVVLFSGCGNFVLMSPSEAKQRYGDSICQGDPDCTPLVAQQIGCQESRMLRWDTCWCHTDDGSDYCRWGHGSHDSPWRPPHAHALSVTPAAIAFVTGANLPTVRFDEDGSGAYTIIAYRQGDGSYTARSFVHTDAATTYIGETPGFQDVVAQVGGVNPRTPAPHPVLLADMVGVSAMQMVVTSLGGAYPYASIQTSTVNKITVLLNNSNTLAQSQTDYQVGTNDGSDPVSLLVADFNGDGHRDVAVLNNPGAPANGTVSILPGKGDGTLGPAVNYNAGVEPGAMTAMDFNGDGRPDLAVASRGGGVASDHAVSILLANADGTFRDGGKYPVPGTQTPMSMVSADFDGDGKADLIVYDSQESLIFLHGNGDGSFEVKTNLAGYGPLYSYPVFLAAGDFNKDGKTDLALLNDDATLTLLLNAGDGSFATRRRYVAGTHLATGYYLVAQLGSMFAMDFNDDGNLDIVLASGHPDILYPGLFYTTVLFGNGDGTLQAPQAYEVSQKPKALAAADFNGDGRLDLVAGGDNSSSAGGKTAAVLLARAGGGFQSAAGLSGSNQYIDWLGTADLNGGGRQDIIGTSSQPLAAQVWLSKGDGTFQAMTTYGVGNSVYGSGNSWGALADLNGDGHPDLVVARGSTNAPPYADDSVYVMLGKSGGFNAATIVNTGTNTVQLVLRDVSGDGKLDLITTNYGYAGTTPAAGSVSVLRGKGDGTFQTPVTYTVGTTPQALAVADVNGDGKPDLIVGTTTGTESQIAVLLGNGDGTFGSPTTFFTYAQASRLAAADFDGDGKADLAIVHAAGDRPISVMRGDGDGTFQPEMEWLAGYSPLALVAADFTGDGKPDLAVAASKWQGFGDGVVGIMRSTSVPLPPVTTIATSPAGLSLVVDGTTLTAPQTFTWTPGAAHMIGVASPQTIDGVKWVYDSWSDGGGLSHSITAPQADTTYRALFNPEQYLLTTTTSPSEGGTITAAPSSADGYYAAGASVQLTAVPASGFTFAGWSGALTGTTNPQSVTLSEARTVTASFAGSPAPTLLSPSNGAGGVVPAPTLTWSAAAGAVSYDVRFGASSPPPFVANTTNLSYAPAGPLSLGATYYWQVVAKNAAGSAASPVWSFTTTSTAATGLRFVPVTPCRVADTRSPVGPFGGPTMAAATSRPFAIPRSPCGIPNTAQAYSLNVTVVPKGPLSYLTLWPTGQSQAGVSTLNSFGGDVVANAAIVPAGADGAVSVYVTNPTDVILDINGYFDTEAGSSSFSFYPATPCRVADTRGGEGTFGGPTMPGRTARDFPVPLSPCGIPAAAGGYSLNVTVVPPGYLGYLTTWPTGHAQPNASTLNSWKGKVVANAALVPAGNNESISVYVSNLTNVILDINGYFGQAGQAGALSFYPVAPCRVADTRGVNGAFGGPKMGAASTRSFPIPASGCNIPATATAYSMNITVVPDGALSYLTTWPTGSGRPLVSTLNSFDGAVVANAAIVPAGTNGAISVFVTNQTHVILDINGYFAP